MNLDTLRSTGLVVREADGETAADLNTFIMLHGRRGYLTFSTDLLLSSHVHKFTSDGEVDPEELDVAVDYFIARMALDPLTQSLFVPSGGPPTDLVLIPEPTGLPFLFAGALALSATSRRQNRRRPHRR